MGDLRCLFLAQTVEILSGRCEKRELFVVVRLENRVVIVHGGNPFLISEGSTSGRGGKYGRAGRQPK